MKNKVNRLTVVLIAALCALSCTSCNKEPSIQKAYDFGLSSWHLQKSVRSGEEVEIRFYLTREGDYRDAEYRIGYIQIDGAGRVYDTGREILINRELHELNAIPGLDKTDPNRWIYTLFYRAGSDKKAELRFFAVDNFNNERSYDITFNPDTSNDEE